MRLRSIRESVNYVKVEIAGLVHFFLALFLLCRIALELRVDSHDLRSGNKGVIKVKDIRLLRQHYRATVAVG